MTTLRARLTLSLWVALALVGSGSAAFVYLRAERETQSLLDYQMQQVARLVAARKIDPTVPTAGRDVNPESSPENDLLVTVRDEAGTVKVTAGPHTRFVFKHGPDLRRAEVPGPADDEVSVALFRLATGPPGTTAVNASLLTSRLT